MLLRDPGVTLTAAGIALGVGAMVIIVGLNVLHWAVG